ncbi:hypothetical protein Taro_024564 [Colocasia esculenta]|uniref:Retrotransposon gag domain-containing protein n=1 Tax=Colocasia esculenta TaxID=4460 RepID=A0A843V7T9_COLES|nr:hypothetical protein [Colocasia esculenta]
MGGLAFDESYLLRYFATSLTGTAFQWYSRLRPNSIVNWADLQKKFIDRFQTAERKVSLAELCSLKQRKGETTLDFIKRWRDFSMTCDNPPTQEDVITICRRGLAAQISEKLLGTNIKGFDQLNSVVAEIEMFFADNPMQTPPKSKPGKERAVGKEANVVDFAPQSKGKKVMTSSAPSKKVEERPPPTSLPQRMSTPYSFKRDHTKMLFKLCMKNDLLTLPRLRRPSEADRVDEPNYCLYHRMLGHSIEDCYVFKNEVQKLIQSRLVTMREHLVDPPQPHAWDQSRQSANIIFLPTPSDTGTLPYLPASRTIGLPAANNPYIREWVDHSADVVTHTVNVIDPPEIYTPVAFTFPDPNMTEAGSSGEAPTWGKQPAMESATQEVSPYWAEFQELSPEIIKQTIDSTFQHQQDEAGWTTVAPRMRPSLAFPKRGGSQSRPAREDASRASKAAKELTPLEMARALK